VAASADLVNALLQACPQLHFLVTSRECLRLVGETIWPVSSLSVPILGDTKFGGSALAALGQYESIKLFAERARAVTQIFELDEQNVITVARLCQRLDGIPLAIELAAARTRLLSVEQLLDRLQDRFRLLTGGNRAALPRQQTLRALVDWSYDLLTDKEPPGQSAGEVSRGGREACRRSSAPPPFGDPAPVRTRTSCRRRRGDGRGVARPTRELFHFLG